MKSQYKLPSDDAIKFLCDLLLAENADHDDVRKVRTYCASGWVTGWQVSVWIDQLQDSDPVVFGATAAEVCKLADRHHFANLNRAKKEQAA